MVTEQRLIYANELEAKMCGLCDEFGTDHLFIDAIVYEIGNTPTVDAVEVVRCKDCKHRGTDYCIFHIKGEPADEALLKKLDNDFCSYGERKDNEQTRSDFENFTTM